MKRQNAGRRAKLILLTGILLLTVFSRAKCEYDDTYVLAVRQKYALPENVYNGDYVGVWLKTRTWNPKGTISFSIENNFHDAFQINPSSGLITVKNQSWINGKIKAQDTVIYLLIKSVDSEVGSETDTAQIWIKENSYCHFIDYNGSSGAGSRNSTLSDLDDIEIIPGHGYFIKRGNIIYNEYTPLTGLIASSTHPTIFAAYDQGQKPEFTDGSNICFYIGDTSGGSEDPVETRSEHISFYDLYVRNYNFAAFYCRRVSNNINWYNLDISNCDKSDIESSLAINTSFPDEGSIGDSSAIYHFEILNCRFDTTSIYCNSGCEKNFIKDGVGPTIITNCYFGYIEGNAQPLRLTAGHGSIVRHCFFNTGSYSTTNQNATNIQCRQDDVIIEDCRFRNLANGIYVTNPGTAGNEVQPDNLTVKNCLFEGHGLTGIQIAPVTTANYPGVGHTFTDNHFTNIANGIELRDCQNSKISRNRFYNGTGKAIFTGSEPSTGTEISYNVFIGFPSNAINYTSGSAAIFNNTILEDIETSGADVDVYNNYLINYQDGDNNIDIETINTADYFVDYGSYDLRLKPTAVGAIDQGIDNPCSLDYLGNSINGQPDIGAYEFNDGTAQNPDPEEPPVEEPPVEEPPVEEPPVAEPPTIPVPIPTDMNVYIDPENTSDELENGTIDHPFNSWQDVKWTSGKSYLQKKGTKSEEDRIIIGASNIIIGSYGTGDLPTIISKTTTYLISAFEKSNISITGLKLEAPNSVSTVYFLGSSSDNITIEKCELKGSQNSIRAVDGGHYTIRYNIIKSEGEGIVSQAKSNDIYYNVFKENEVAVNIPGTLSEARIYNNIFAGNNQGVTSGYAALTLFNNIFYFTDAGQKALKYISGKISSDHNIFYPLNADFIEIEGKSYSKLDELQQQVSLDLNSFTEDPLFVDMIHEDYNVEDKSPAIDNGVSLNILADFAGNLVPYYAAPDIGVFEFRGTRAHNESNITVFPNPSSGVIKVDFKEVIENEVILGPVSSISSPVLKILDLSGRILLSRQITNPENTTESFDLSQLANGIYMIMFERLGKTITHKIILSR